MLYVRREIDLSYEVISFKHNMQTFFILINIKVRYILVKFVLIILNEV